MERADHPLLVIVYLPEQFTIYNTTIIRHYKEKLAYCDLCHFLFVQIMSHHRAKPDTNDGLPIIWKGPFFVGLLLLCRIVSARRSEEKLSCLESCCCQTCIEHVFFIVVVGTSGHKNLLSLHQANILFRFSLSVVESIISPIISIGKNREAKSSRLDHGGCPLRLTKSSCSS